MLTAVFRLLRVCLNLILWEFNMTGLYDEKSPSVSRIGRDVMFADRENLWKYEGHINEVFGFVNDRQICRPELWERFMLQFRTRPDSDGGWRGEFWGKMMRGACFVYRATKNKELYSVLEKAVCDMMDSADENGRISSYSVEREFRSWDMWCRKYVMLGMEYFYEICDDEALRGRIVSSLRGQLDYIISKVGKREEGKTPICETSDYWRGLNSSSVLEPVMKLYNMTGDKRYLDFGGYIAECGGTSVENIFDLALNDKMMPYQYPVTKAYEMISCFEGVLEYYRVTGDEKYRSAVVNIGKRVLETDFTVIGSGGCTGEQFDHSFVRQANTTNSRVKQETCVTVTYMKFFLQLLLVTGDPVYADAFERAHYNAYEGSLNTEWVFDADDTRIYDTWVKEPVPFDSYSPLTVGKRGNNVGGLMNICGDRYYGCCACIGSAGIGLVPEMQVLTYENGLALNLFLPGEVTTRTPSGNRVRIVTTTDYPVSGKVKLALYPEAAEKFELSVRNPGWSGNTKVSLNGDSIDAASGYIRIFREWKSGDTIELELDMRIRTERPTPYGHQILMTKVDWGHNYILPVYDEEDPAAKYHIALLRGPVVLAQDSRLGNEIDGAVQIAVDSEGYAEGRPTSDIPFPHVVGAEVLLSDGSYMKTVDYGSAGKLWTNKSRVAAWILTKDCAGK